MSGQTSNQSLNPSDPDFPNLELVYTEEWAVDVIERLKINDIKGAMTSLSFANLNLLKLPPGLSYPALEDFLQVLGVKLFQNQGSNKP
jgi:hypothetical protein